MSTSEASTVANPREQRGIALAQSAKIRRKGNGWLVPAQSDTDPYTVNVEGDTSHCTCPDHTIRRVVCKHIFAVRYTIEWETQPDGSVTETVTQTVTKRVQRTYPQNWTAYNAAQTEEWTRFLPMLASLCENVAQPVQTIGRPRLPLSEMVFAAVLKVYTGFSSRRFIGHLVEAHAQRLIQHVPHFNSVSNYLDSAELTPVLKDLIAISSLPLRTVETAFAVDSSGFTTCRFIRWFNKKYGKDIDNREWVKVHLMCGVTTHIVTSVEISGWEAHDTTFFKPLLATAAKQFRIVEVSGDKAYLSHGNVTLVEQAGGVPFIPFKVNSAVPHDDSAWTRMYHYFAFQRERFLEHYHMRSNVETVFSMIKGKFGDAVRSKGDTGMANEVLCKVLCHNLYVLIQAIHEFGIDPTFCAGSPVAQEVGS